MEFRPLDIKGQSLGVKFSLLLLAHRLELKPLQLHLAEASLFGTGSCGGTGKFQFLPLVLQLAFKPLTGALHQQPLVVELSGHRRALSFQLVARTGELRFQLGLLLIQQRGVLLAHKVAGSFLAFSNVRRSSVVQGEHEMDVADTERGVVAVLGFQPPDSGQAGLFSQVVLLGGEVAARPAQGLGD